MVNYGLLCQPKGKIDRLMNNLSSIRISREELEVLLLGVNSSVTKSELNPKKFLLHINPTAQKFYLIIKQKFTEIGVFQKVVYEHFLGVV